MFTEYWVSGIGGCQICNQITVIWLQKTLHLHFPLQGTLHQRHTLLKVIIISVLIRQNTTTVYVSLIQCCAWSWSQLREETLVRLQCLSPKVKQKSAWQSTVRKNIKFLVKATTELHYGKMRDPAGAWPMLGADSWISWLQFFFECLKSFNFMEMQY